MAFLKKYRKLTIGVGIVLVLVVIFLAVRGNSAPPGSEFQTTEIQLGNLTATVGATGSVRAKSSAVLVWQTNGVVETINVEVGDRVPQDQVLASLDRASLPQSIILAEADLVSAQQALEDLQHSGTATAQAAIALDKAEQDYKKAYDYRQSLNGRITIREVVIIRGVPQIKERKGYADAETIADADEKLALALAQLEDAQRAYDRVKNGASTQDIAAAEARVAAAEATLNMANVSAPFAGTVTQATPSVGDQVSAGSVAFRLDDLSHLLVDVQVSEVDINTISLDMPVTLSFDAILGTEYHGTVVEVGQAGDTVQGVVNFTVTVEISDADELVKPGMTAAVNIVVNEVDNVLLVPNRAVRLVDGERVVYVLKDGMPVMVNIRLGQSSDTMSVVVGGDLKVGDPVILNPPAQNFGPFGG
ncbi:MAG: efflux RND transporter periplasmic adaptor subunit [Chloroflexota bacterium]